MVKGTPSLLVAAIAALALAVLPGCPGPGPGPGPQPTPTPWKCELGMPGCHETNPPQSCSAPGAPCWHNPTSNPQHCEQAPACDTPELPQPQCQTFTDRGGDLRRSSESCDCYFGQAWNPCPSAVCSFPQGQSQNLTMGPVLRLAAPTVNTAMRELTGCDIGTDCPTGMAPDEWMHAVIEAVQSTGLCAGRHIDATPGGTDEIAVAMSCGGWWEGYKIYNYGGGKVIWSPNADRPAWRLNDPSVCGAGPQPTPPPGPTPTPPPSGDCPAPHPDTDRMKFKATEHNGILDTTWVTVNQEPFCRAIGMSPMGDGTLRAGCPVRPEGGEGSEERAACEAELCGQKWECNGEPYPPYKGNTAQTNCRGHWKTYCTNAPTVAEGNR